MNIRGKYILNLLEQGDQIDIDSIALKLNVHSRTIRNDLEEIDRYLTEKIGKPLVISDGRASIAITSEERRRLESDNRITDLYSEKLSVEERVLLMLYDICSAPGYLTIQQLANKYYVSRGTVNTDLIAIKDWCRQNEIPLAARKGKGLHVEAAEQQRRRYLTKIIRSYEAVKDYGGPGFSEYGQWFNDISIADIRNTVTKQENEFGVRLTDVSFEGLVLHIALAVKRHRNHDDFIEPVSNPSISEDSVAYKMAEAVIGEINQLFGIAMPKGEIYYVAVHLGDLAPSERSENLAFLDYVVLDLIADVSRSMPVDLRNDARLYDGLIHHLSACVYRTRNNMPLHNPLKDDIKQSYASLFEAIRCSIHAHQRQNILLETDDELAYIALHFAAAIARNEVRHNRQADVVIVCSTGVGTAELVSSIIKKNFRVNIKDSIALHQLRHYLEEHKCDLIISTVPISGDFPHIQVNPLLNQADFENLHELLTRMGFDSSSPQPSVRGGVSETARKVMEAVSKFGAPADERKLKSALARYLKDSSEGISGKKGETKMLYELLRESDMKLDCQAGDWREAIQAAGDLLIRDGSITQAYIDGVVANMKEMGPYFVITKGVALPHTTNKVGVNRIAMSFVRLKEPVAFGNKSNDPVEFVFLLATVDATSHLGALQDLAEFLGRDEFMELIRQAKDVHDIAAYLKHNAVDTGKEENYGE